MLVGEAFKLSRCDGEVSVQCRKKQEGVSIVGQSWEAELKKVEFYAGTQWKDSVSHNQRLMHTLLILS